MRTYNIIKSIALLIFSTFLLSTLCYSQELVFVKNEGQWKENFVFKSQNVDNDFYLHHNGYTINMHHNDNKEILHKIKHGEIKGDVTLKYHAYNVTWIGANDQPKITSSGHKKYYNNYFLGNNASSWKTNIHPCTKVLYNNIYDGIDVIIDAENANVKYNYMVQPFANASLIKLKYQGIDKLSIIDNKLIIKTSVGNIIEQQPYTYQEIEGKRVIVNALYQKNGDVISFSFPEGYNKEYPLVIDPTIVFATLTGSVADNWGFSATYDNAGNLYAGGIVSGAGYPITTGAYDITFNGGGSAAMPGDIAITKFNASGASLIYSTYLGGNGTEQPHSMVVDNANNLIVAGKTNSTNFPAIFSSYDTTNNGGYDIYISKFNSTGSALLGSTYIGGSSNDGLNIDESLDGTFSDLKYNYGDNSRSEVLVDKNNNIWLSSSTQSSNYPITASAAKTTLTGLQDGVLIKMNSSLSNLMYSTYIGGSSSDAAYVITFDTSQNNIFVGGGTMSSDFMSGTTATGHSSTYQGGTVDGFISKFNANPPYNIIRSTFVGTSGYDQVHGLQTDRNNNVYALGQTTGAFPVYPSTTYSNPNGKLFLRSFNTNITSANFSTILGGPSTSQVNLVPVAFLVDTCSQIYLSGWGGAVNGASAPAMSGFPITPDAFQSTTDGSDFYLMALRSNATGLLYGSYFGSNGKAEHVDGGTSRFSPTGVIYQSICATCGSGSAYPSTPGSWSMTKGSSNCNLGALKMAFNLGNVSAIASASPNAVGCAPFTVTFENTSINAASYYWDFGDGGTSGFSTPTHTYTSVGTYTVMLIANNNGGCKNTDTTYLTITVTNDTVNASFNYQIIDSCTNYTVKFTNTSSSYNPTPFTTATYRWIFGDGSPDYYGVTPPNKNYPGVGTYTVMLIMTDTNACNSPDTAFATIVITSGNTNAAFDVTDTCVENNRIVFDNQSTNGSTYFWSFGDGGTSTEFEPTHTYDVASTFTVTLIVYNPNSCNKVDTIVKDITIHPKPNADFYTLPVVTEVNKPINFVNTSTGATAYSWDFGDGTTSTEVNPSHLYGLTGNYTVCLTATNQYNCIDTVCKSVYTEIKPLIDVPTGFSPNGDGANNILYVRGYAVKEMNFRVYNRWGELVFETNDMNKGWDGTYKGKQQPMEVYAYILNATFNDNTKYTKKGNVTLLR